MYVHNKAMVHKTDSPWPPVPSRIRSPGVLLIWTLTLVLSWWPPSVTSVIDETPGFNCPHPEEILPIVCTPWPLDDPNPVSIHLDLTDRNPYTNFTEVAAAMQKIRYANLARIVQVEEFYFVNSEHREVLDLSFLSGLNITHLGLLGLRTVKEIKRAPRAGEIMVHEVHLMGTNLLPVGISNVLSYINKQTGPQRLVIEGAIYIAHDEPRSHLIPELDQYGKLEWVQMTQTGIIELHEGAFTGPDSLSYLHLSNNIEKLKKGAFKFGRRIWLDRPFEINLSDNELKIDSKVVNIEPGFLSSDDIGPAGYILNLETNSLEYLPENVFKDLLSPKGPVRKLKVKNNKFVCDDRMSWVKNLNESVVEGVDCTNDPGKTIFTTKKVARKAGATVGSMPLSMSSVLFVVVLLSFFELVKNNH